MSDHFVPTFAFCRTVEGLLERDLFVRWLKARDAEQVIGEATHSELCPLAHYLQDVTGQAISVTCLDVQFGWFSEEECKVIRKQLCKLPAWAEEFVEQVDYADEAEIRAEVALQLLIMLERRDG